jgi:hypothetical protein
MDSRNLLRHVKVALRTKDKVAENPDELLKCIKVLNPGLHMEHWRVLDRQSQPKGHRLVLLVDWDFLKTIKETGYKIFTGLIQGTIMVLRDHEERPKQEEGATVSTASSRCL